MSTVVLHRGPAGTPPPPAEWFAGPGGDPVLVTDVPGVPAGYAEVRHVGRYAHADAETGVLDLARHRTVTAVVALHPADQVRAGALRDALGLPGQSRDEALVLADALAAHAHLDRAGVPVTRRAGVRRILDLHRAAHTWGYPLAVRRSRTPGRETVAVLRDEAELRAFARGGLTDGSVTAAPALMVEPYGTAERHEGPGLPVTDAVAAVLPPDPGHPYVVQAVRRPGGTWRVDGVRYRPGDPRAQARAQAAAAARTVEVA